MIIFKNEYVLPLVMDEDTSLDDVVGSHHTYAGRYFENSRGYDDYWPFDEVMRLFGDKIKNVLSLGCSNGINESIIASRYPQLCVTAIDIYSPLIEQAKAGEWDFKDIFKVTAEYPDPIENIAIRRFLTYCPLKHFALDLERSALRRRNDLSNLSYAVMDAQHMEFSDDSFDLIIMHMLGGAFYGGKHVIQIGKEVSRVLRDEGLFSTCFGLHMVFKTSESCRYHKLFSEERDYRMQNEPTPIESPTLFPPEIYIV